VLLTILALITLAVMAALAWFLVRVPEAPFCPRCGAATACGPAAAAGAGPSRWLDRLAMPRVCTDCGWTGRQRGGGEPGIVGRAGPGSRR
jgi:hypothetical protein